MSWQAGDESSTNKTHLLTAATPAKLWRQHQWMWADPLARPWMKSDVTESVHVHWLAGPGLYYCNCGQEDRHKESEPTVHTPVFLRIMPAHAQHSSIFYWHKYMAIWICECCMAESSLWRWTNSFSSAKITVGKPPWNQIHTSVLYTETVRMSQTVTGHI